MSKKYGLIGYPLGYSFSPNYFAKKFQKESISAEYKAYPIPQISDLHKLLESGVDGLNVTIPYKEKVLPLLDEIDEEAKAIGAVNTIKKVEGKLVGYNTDIIGFRQSLLGIELPFELSGSRALILGTGGASKAINYVLSNLGIICHYASRKADNERNVFSYDQLSQFHLSCYAVIVNTTPLGTYPNVEEIPNIPIWDLGPDQLVYDLIYNPERTRLLRDAESLGCHTKNGLEMLELQAEKSWEIWNT